MRSVLLSLSNVDVMHRYLVMTENSSCTETTSVVARKLSSGFQYVSDHGSKVYKENSFITQQVGYIKHLLTLSTYPVMASTTPTI
jgi:hypothetical protein